MLKEDVISKEYHQALLHEKERGDLARKIHLWRKGTCTWKALVPLCCLNFHVSKPQNMTDNEPTGRNYISGKSVDFFSSFFALLKIYFYCMLRLHSAKYSSGEHVGKSQILMQEQLKRDTPL